MAENNIRKQKDRFLEVRLARYDRWLREGKITTSSKVIPIGESLSARQWVLKTDQAIEILRRCKTFALARCLCRSHYKRCRNPVEVCLMIDAAADKYVAAGEARYISIEEAEEVLRTADQHGLVHLTLSNPEQKVFALCNCCPCCCHDLLLLRTYGRNDLIARSEFISLTDLSMCVHCGDCVMRCVFKARSMDDGIMVTVPKACYGCGLCVTICPEQAIVMEPRTIPE